MSEMVLCTCGIKTRGARNHCPEHGHTGKAGSVPEITGGSDRDTQTPAEPPIQCDDCLQFFPPFGMAYPASVGIWIPRCRACEKKWRDAQAPGKYCVDCGVLINGGGTDRSMLDPNICWECGEGQFI